MIRHPVLRAAALLLLVAWAPLPFGSVTPRAAAFLQAAALVAAAMALAVSRRELSRGAARAALALAAVAAFGLLQSIAWPAGLVALVSPGHARLARETAELVGAPPPARIALSLAPGASVSAAADWLLPAAGLVAAALLGRSRRARRAFGVALGASALFQVIFGAQRWMARSTAIWGVEVGNDPGRLRGTFVNPNHLATYLAIAVAAAFALLWWSFRRLPPGASAERRLGQLGPPALLWLALFAGLAFTRSRAGLLAALAGCLVQLASVARGPGRRAALVAGAVALAGAIGFVATTGAEAGFGRLLGLSSSDVVSAGGRGEAMRATAELVASFPVSGAGLGTFRAAFPLVHPPGKEGTWWHAHSDLLELAATVGIVGLALVAFAAVALVRELARAWRDGERGEDRAAALAAIGALVAVAAQETLEFGLTMPANAFTLAVVCGAACAVPRLKRVES